jgi:Rrf2 family transcriptional regulator, cysteine metabolism repressor
VRLTSRGEYGLLALIYLARHYQEGFLPAEEIATAQQIPLKFLEQILASLKMGKIVQSKKGQQGGYQLARGPEAIRLAEVIRLLDGPLAPSESVSLNFFAATPADKEEKLKLVLVDIRDYVVRKLENTTLADVA